MALLRQCLQSVRAMRGDELPPPLSQCASARRVSVTNAASGAAYIADDSRYESVEHAAAETLRHRMAATRTGLATV
jgi:hypothetical protein